MGRAEGGVGGVCRACLRRWELYEEEVQQTAWLNVQGHGQPEDTWWPFSCVGGRGCS